MREMSVRARSDVRGARHVLAIVVACSVVLGSFAGCQSTPAESAPAQADVSAVQSTLDKLYAAFCFEARGSADWDTIRDLCADGAVFVAPISAKKTPRAVGIDEFLRDYHAYVASEAVRNTGLHERIVHTRIDLYGSIAHAYVAFEGLRAGARHRDDARPRQSPARESRRRVARRVVHDAVREHADAVAGAIPAGG